MNLESLKRVFADHGCQKVYVKTLSGHDSSKHGVYVGTGFGMLNIFPVSDIQAESPGVWKRERFKASLAFSWIGEDGLLYSAPQAKFILYPNYPEVRFSGFLNKCPNAPSDLMRSNDEGRLLFLSVTDEDHTLGFVTSAHSTLATEFLGIATVDTGIFKMLEIGVVSSRILLIKELKRIHQLNWIVSRRLDKFGNTVACNADNCGGFTLEAEFGIRPNSYSAPDFLGWEIKQFGVEKFTHTGSIDITLMTPEPKEGLYASRGADYFIRTYGYPDTKGRPDRLNFGGVHKVGKKDQRTHLTMTLIGFDGLSGKIYSSTGRIALIDEHGNEAAAWPFASMLLHWNRKHNQACYVPSLCIKGPIRQYHYGKLVMLGTGTDFELFLQQLYAGNIQYDPGISMKNVSTKPVIKKRSQFRIKSSQLGQLYKTNEVVDVTI